MFMFMQDRGAICEGLSGSSVFFKAGIFFSAVTDAVFVFGLLRHRGYLKVNVTVDPVLTVKKRKVGDSF